MKARIKFFFTFLIYWLLLFMAGKIFFLLYQFNHSFSLSISDWMAVLWHGMMLDLSTLGYLSTIPVVILSLTSFWKGRVAMRLLNIYTLVALILFVVITLTDLGIFRAWSVHFDYTPLLYLGSPYEVLANLTWYHLMLALAAAILLSYGLYIFYRRKMAPLLENASTGGFPAALSFFFLLPLLFIPVRGGLGTTPINISSASFHKNIFANQAAINVLWYFGHSIAEGKETRNPYIFFKQAGYEKELKELYAPRAEPVQLLNEQRPTVVLILMETFTAKLIEPLGGPSGVTPHFNALAREGIFFTHMYANGTRTDRGLVSVVSGFPTVEPVSVLKYPEKTMKMPFLSRNLIKEGYSATFYYGGDIEFANMKSYLINGGFNPVYSESDFSRYKGYRSNWGVPDHVVYDKLISALQKQTSPGLHVMLTLSHHEPFDIPGEPLFKGSGIENKFYSSAYFADSCLGDFIAKMKRTDQWDHTLIILVADHGSPLPDFSQYHEPAKYRIPMLWLGGALKKDTVVTAYGAQSDITLTLLNQMKINHTDYILSKDLLSPSSGSFTFYSFMDGMAMMSDSMSFGYDFETSRLLFSEGPVTDRQIGYAKALQQYVYDYYLSR